MMGVEEDGENEEKKEDSGKKEKSKKKKAIPPYMQDLFNHFCNDLKQFGNIIWLNKEEFSKLNKQMQQRLQLSATGNDSDETGTGSFAKYLQATRKIKIKYPSTVSLLVKDAQLDAFWKGNKLAMPHMEFEVEDTASQETPKPKVTLVLRMRIAK